MSDYQSILSKIFLTFLLNTLIEVNNLSDDSKLFQNEQNKLAT